jgi:hypothetical protein
MIKVALTGQRTSCAKCLRSVRSSSGLIRALERSASNSQKSHTVCKICIVLTVSAFKYPYVGVFITCQNPQKTLVVSLPKWHAECWLVRDSGGDGRGESVNLALTLIGGVTAAIRVDRLTNDLRHVFEFPPIN